MVVRPEDAEVAEVLSSSDTFDTHGWLRVLEYLREKGYCVRKTESAGPDFSAAYLRCEPKIQEVLRRRAPPGTHVTPELVASVQRDITAIIVDELKRSGVGASAAQVIGGIMCAAINFKEK